MVKKIDIREEGRDERTGLLKDKELTSRVIETFNECIVKFDILSPTKTPYSVVLFDVDYFKAVNDLFGYDHGNTVLSGIGEILLSHESKDDFLGVLGRWGGEEFLMVLPYTSIKSAKYIADEIRELVEKFSFEDPTTQEKSLKNFITVSLGVSSVDLEEVLLEIKEESKERKVKAIKETFGDLLRKANYALDYAKFMGKNRVEVFREYLQDELGNLSVLRTFYFKYSHMKSRELKNVLEVPYLQENKQIQKKIKEHFNMIKSEINPKDTRTQALLADNLYRLVSQKGENTKKYFMEFVKKLI